MDTCTRARSTRGGYKEQVRGYARNPIAASRARISVITTGQTSFLRLRGRVFQIAAKYRHLIPRGKSVLFYGTKHPRSIIRDDGIHAENFISLTRSFHVAIHFAMLARDEEETTGAVLILDRDLLRNKYSLKPYNDLAFLNIEKRSAAEAEESVLGPVVDLKKYLLGVIWLRDNERYIPMHRRPNRHQALPSTKVGGYRERLKAAASLQRLFRSQFARQMLPVPPLPR